MRKPTSTKKNAYMSPGSIQWSKISLDLQLLSLENREMTDIGNLCPDSSERLPLVRVMHPNMCQPKAIASCHFSVVSDYFPTFPHPEQAQSWPTEQISKDQWILDIWTSWLPNYKQCMPPCAGELARVRAKTPSASTKVRRSFRVACLASFRIISGK